LPCHFSLSTRLWSDFQNDHPLVCGANFHALNFVFTLELGMYINSENQLEIGTFERSREFKKKFNTQVANLGIEHKIETR
jgi:hypothetical protein